MIQLHPLERARLMEPVTLDELQEIFTSEILTDRYDLDDTLFVIENGRMFYYFGIINDEQVQLIATSAANIFDTESTR